MQSVKNSNRNTGPQEKKLNTYSLAGLGVGGIIGSGFFLGSAISIRQAGPSVILSFLLSGLVVSQVLGAITSISINRPVTGSFKVYAEQFLGKYAGFTMGWVLYISNLLAIGSEAVAAGIFIRFWVPKVSVAVSAFSITVLVILINRLNTNQFSLVESGMAVLKISALLFFIIAAIRFIAANGIAVKSNPFSSLQAFLPNGISGFFQSMLIAVFSYAGISTVAMATAKVKKPKKEIPAATILMIASIILFYVAAMFLIICIVNWKAVNTGISPLVQALSAIGLGWASAIINAAIFIAAVSVMLGTYFGSVQILLSLSDAGEAPKAFGKANRKGFFRNAWLLTGLLSLSVVGLSFLLSSKLFNYLISACSYFSFFSWTINLIIFLMWLKRRHPQEKFISPMILGKGGSYMSLAVIAILIFFSLGVEDYRIGFFTAAGLILLISMCYLFYQKERKHSR
ncbi:gamma-aminobutyrate permease-like transporter [Clostridium sp. W14A]|nr:gamma-aminobutyrate permease-like transporter [Clostridium sp. W14A]